MSNPQKPDPIQPRDYHPEENPYRYDDKPSPIPAVIAVVSGLLIFIAMAASNFL